MKLKIILFLGLLLNTANTLKINEDDFNKVTNQLQHLSQELQEYKVNFGSLKQKLSKPDCILQLDKCFFSSFETLLFNYHLRHGLEFDCN